MSVNGKPTASQQNMNNLPISKFFSFFAGVIDPSTQLLHLNIFVSFRQNSNWWRGVGMIYEKNLKSTVSCQTRHFND
jgi:hypothetical protein